MAEERQYYVYIVTNAYNTVLYTGVTNSLQRRVWQHRNAAGNGATFAGRYRLAKLIHFEIFRDVENAIAREKQIKGWVRAKKVALVRQENPFWKDLSAGWY